MLKIFSPFCALLKIFTSNLRKKVMCSFQGAPPPPAAAKTDGASEAANPVLPGMVTSVALPGLPPLNVTVPSFSLPEKSAGKLEIDVFRTEDFLRHNDAICGVMCAFCFRLE